MKTLVIIILTLIFASLAGLAMLGSGYYNVAANDKHFALTSQLLEGFRNRSVMMQSKDILIPELEDKIRIRRGAEHYAEMCSGCHLAPDMKATELHQGLYPEPPVFSNTGYNNPGPAAQFWIIQNGLKMTGMPAWSPAHSDDQIWDMVAFLNKIKTLSPEQYQQLTNGVMHNEHHHHHEHEDDEDHHEHNSALDLGSREKQESRNAHKHEAGHDH